MSRISGLWALALLHGVAGCSSGGSASAPTVKVERSAEGAQLFSIESDTLVDGKRPWLTLVCEPGKPATFMVDLIRPPPSPPTPRGVFAQLQVKGGPEVTIELGYMGGAGWRARYPHPDQPQSDTNDRNNRERVLPILHAFTRERKLTLRPPAAYAPAGDLVWSPQTFGPHLRAARACADLPDLTG